MSSIFGPDVAYQTYASMIFQKINQESIDLAFEHLEYEGNLGKFVGWLLKNTSIDWSLYPTIESLCASDTTLLPMLANAPVMYAMCLKSSYTLAIATAALTTVTRRMALYNSDPALIRLLSAGAGAPFIMAGTVYNHLMNGGSGVVVSWDTGVSPVNLVQGGKYLIVSGGSSGSGASITASTVRGTFAGQKTVGVSSSNILCESFTGLVPVTSPFGASWGLTMTSYTAYLRMIRCDA